VGSRLDLTVRRRVSTFTALFISLVVLMAPSPNYAQGFGTPKEKVVLHRKLPAVVHLSGTSFVVKATSHSPSEAEVAQLLPDMLGNELLKNEKSLRVDSESPQVTIACTITNYETPPKQTITRNQTVLQKGKLVQKPTTYYEVTGQLDVTYKVTEKSGAVIDSNNVTSKYSREFQQGTNQATDSKMGGWLKNHISDQLPNVGGGDQAEKPTVPPTAEQLRQELLQGVMEQVGPRLVVTNEAVDVFLAGGKLSEANKTAEKGLWSRYLETLDTMTPLPNPQEDAYRLYNMGVANEALGYEAEDRAAAKKFLQEAAIDYGKAIDAKPDEKYFLDSQARIETAVTYYRTLGEPVMNAAQKDNDSAANHAGGSAPLSNDPPPTHAGSSGPLDNEKIIQMFKSGVDEESILEAIRQAPTVDFHLDPDSLIKLATNGIKGKIPAAMRQRMHPAKPPVTHK
jgi:hypothetical protein